MDRTRVPRALRWTFVAAALLAAVVAPVAARVARAAPPVAAPAKPASPAPAKPGAAVEDLSPLLAPIRAKHDVPALCAAFVRHDRVVAIGVDGVRRRGDPTKATTDDLWHLGSCTKSMTATLVAKLVEEGAMTWDETLGRFEAGFFPKDADAGWKNVTVEELLTNRSGAPTNLDADGLWGVLWRREGTPVAQRRRLLEGVLRHPPLSPPGTKFLYSNAGFSIAGELAEVRTKTAYEDLLRAKLFVPLHLDSAGFGPPGKAGVLDEPRAHTAAGSPVEPGIAADNPPAIAPAGLVHMTIRDWATYVAMHLLGDRGESTFLTLATFRRLHTPPAGFDYAMGWIAAERPWGGGTVLTHAGTNTMWYAVTWIAPKRDFAVVITCNQGGDAAAKACDDVASALVTR